MEQLWLVLSLLSLATGCGLVAALLVLKRLAPVAVPPVINAMVAFLLMGLASFFGVYLRVLGLPRSIIAYRLLNAGAWGYAAFALSFYLGRTGNLFGSGVRASAPIRAGAAGVLVLAAAFLAAHPPPRGLLTALPAGQTAVMIGVELVVGVLAVLVGLRALSGSRRLTSRPWRAYLRGFGIALLLLIPANLLDFAVSLVLRSAGTAARDGFVFAAGYGIANVVLIAAIVRGIRVSGSGAPPAMPQQMIDAFGLTRREREVTEKLLEGKTDREIAGELYISPRTVDTHLRSIFRKCGVSSRMQLTRLVSSYGELRNLPEE